MPEKPPSNRPVVPLPARRNLAGARPVAPRPAPPPYAELLAASNFSFLRGASHPEELAAAAAVLGLSGFAIADRNTLSGIVRGHLAAKTTETRYAVGCRLVFRDGTPDVAVWPSDRAAYGRLCRLLSAGNLRAAKGACHLDRADLLEWGEGLAMAVLPPRRPAEAVAGTLRDLDAAFPGRVRLGATCLYHGDDRRRLATLDRLAGEAEVPLLALGDILHHAPERRRLQDVLACIREHVTLEEAGRRLEANAERHMKAPAEMARLFRDYPGALRENAALFESLAFSLDELRYEYPLESAGESATPFDELVRLTFEGAARRNPSGLPDKVRAAIDHELKLIRQLGYAPYFLTVWDIVRFARTRGILCQGRGSAANSAVCFCLGVTEVDPERGDLLFERFISPERNEPPDIDVDFEHERREEVIQYVYEKYGRERAGLAATVITYRSRSAAREVGKAFGLSDDAVGALSGNVWGWSSTGVDGDDAKRAGLDPADRRVGQILELSREIIGFPRHLSQHVGGFVITRSRLDEVVPILHSAMDGRTIIEWDKDDLDALKILKIDVLALGMLTAMSRALTLMKDHYGLDYGLADIPAEEPEVYDMICRADTIGVFQIESRAQMTMLPRLRPQNFYDLVIEVAIVRPGPIQGDMVHPYLKRRQNPAAVTYPKPAPPHDPDELKTVLEKTLGVPLFQEQAMRIAIVAAKFEPWEADKLRRAMATFRRVGTIHTFQEKMVEGMVARGYERGFAEHCFRQIEGFGEYGFPESHAASFALLVYASSWVKCRYPDVFCAALLNAQPMGFYAPAQLVRDAGEHGVEMREVDVNFSEWDATLEERDEESSPLAGEGREGGRPHPLAMPHSHLPPENRDNARRLRREQTPAEALLWRELRAHRLDGFGFRRQVPMGRYVADFVCHAAKLVVEVDGEVHRGREAQDRERDEWFRSRGYHTLRVGNGEVLSHPERVVEWVRRVCAERSGRSGESGADGCPPSPALPRKGGGCRIYPRHASQAAAIRTRCAVRLGLRQIKGMREADAQRLVERRGAGYASVRDLWARSDLDRGAMERLAEADAFRSLGIDRRTALWEVRALDPLSAERGLPLFAEADGTPKDLRSEPAFPLPAMPLGEHVVNDYRSIALSLKAHPVAFLRHTLAGAGTLEAGKLAETRNGRRVTVAGLVLVRQRPGTAQGVIFATLEDETGVANIIVWPKVFERCRATLLGARFLSVTGRLQSEQGVIHVVAERMEDLTPLLSRLSDETFGNNGIARADEVRRPVDEHRLKVKPQSRLTRMLAADPDLKTNLEHFARQARSAMPKGRNFQ